MKINQSEIKLQLQDEEWPLTYTDHDREIVRAIVFDDEGYFYFVTDSSGKFYYHKTSAEQDKTINSLQQGGNWIYEYFD